LYAVVDPDLDKGRALQRDFGFAVSFSDLDSMVAQERPDAALVLTPYWLNGQVSATVLEAGIHILTEKPPGMSAAQTRRLAALAAAGRLVAQIGYNRRHWPALQEGLAWMRASGQDIQYLRGTKHRTNRIHEDYAFYTSSHVIDTLLSIGGAATECRMLLVGYFPPVFYVPTEVEGRRNAVCGAVRAAATCVTWSSFAPAGGSDLENRWDRSLQTRSPRIKHDTGRARLLGTRSNRRTSASSLFHLFSHQEHILWLSSSVLI
jgi:predicted dehydrogenase